MRFFYFIKLVGNVCFLSSTVMVTGINVNAANLVYKLVTTGNGVIVRQ